MTTNNGKSMGDFMVKKEKVLWVDVHKQNKLFVELLLSVQQTLEVSKEAMIKMDAPGFTVLIGKVNSTCVKHASLGITDLPASDVEVDDLQYMNYFNAFSSITECIGELEAVFDSLTKKGILE